MTKKHINESMEGIHEIASDLRKAGIISQKSMEQYDRLCLPTEVTGENCVPDIIEYMDESDIENLAVQINANVSFVSKLLNKRVLVNTIPHSIMESLVKEFGVPYEHLKEYLESEEIESIQDQDLDSIRTTTITNRYSFEELVRSSDLNDEQQSKLLLSEKSDINYSTKVNVRSSGTG